MAITLARQRLQPDRGYVGSLEVAFWASTAWQRRRRRAARAASTSRVPAKLSLLVGFVPLGVAALYVLRALERTLAYMRPVSLATIFAALCGLVTGCIGVLQGLAASANPGWGNVYMGSEALMPAFLNFELLSASWLLVAVGMWRRTP